MNSLLVGYWIEKEPRSVTEHTRYAADHIDKITVPGRYPVYLHFVAGYMIPMPYWVMIAIDANVVDGGYYSGFGGVNFGFTPAEKGPRPQHVQMYAYQLAGLIESGQVEPNESAKFADWEKNPVTWEWLQKGGYG